MHLGTQPKLNHGVIATRYQQHFNAFVTDEATQKPAASGFLLCIMSPEATRDPVYGVEAILESWSVIAAHFDDIHFKLSDLKTLITGILVGTTTTSVTIRDRTLRMAFPHLNSDGMGGLGGGEWSSLALKLIGKRLVVRGSMRFHLDNASNRVVRVESEADMLSPMARLLGSLKSVHQVLNQALITPDFSFKANP